VCGAEKGIKAMSNSVQKPQLSDEILFEEPYQRLLSELESLAPEDVYEVNLDIPTAVATVFGVLPQLRAFRDSIVKQLPAFDIARFDKLEEYTMSLSYANTVHATASRPVDGLAELSDEGAKLKGVFQNDILALVSRGLIDPVAIKNYTGYVGYKNIASDLQIQCHVLKSNWSQIEGKCAITMPEIEHALKVAAHLLRLVGQKEQSPLAVAAAADMRKRAFTLFTRAYDDARRAILFLRWHEEDADTIAPSLYAGRSSAKKTNPNESVPAPAVSSVQTTSPATNATTTTAPTTTNSTTKSNAGGVSNNNPFMT
jgi:hypothetical protein